MNKFYLMVLLGWMMVVGAAYWVGVRVGQGDCRAGRQADVAQSQLQVINIQRNVNESVVKRSADDVRHVLRTKYTIAE